MLQKKTLSILLTCVIIAGSTSCSGILSKPKSGNAEKVIRVPDDLKTVIEFSFITIDSGYGKFPIYRSFLEIKYLTLKGETKRKLYPAYDQRYAQATLVKGDGSILKKIYRQSH